MRKWSKSVIDICPGLYGHENRAAPWRKVFLKWPWFVDALHRLKGEHVSRRNRNERENAIY